MVLNLTLINDLALLSPVNVRNVTHQFSIRFDHTFTSTEIFIYSESTFVLRLDLSGVKHFLTTT